MPVLISGLCPFTFLCLSSLPLDDMEGLMILTDASPKCFNRNVLITGVVNHLHCCLDTRTHTNTHHMEKTDSFYMYVLHFMSHILSCSH